MDPNVGPNLALFDSKAGDDTPGAVRRYVASTVGVFDLTDTNQLMQYSKIRPKKSTAETIKTVECPHTVRSHFSPTKFSV